MWTIYFQTDYVKRSVHKALYKDDNKTTGHQHFSLPIKKMHSTDNIKKKKQRRSLIHRICKRLEEYSLGRIRQNISNTIPKLKKISRDSSYPGLKQCKCLHRPQHTQAETAEFLTCQHMFTSSQVQHACNFPWLLITALEWSDPWWCVGIPGTIWSHLLGITLHVSLFEI